MGFIILRTRWGQQARFVGENRGFSEYLGVNVRNKIIQIVLISGALAGIAGVVASLGTQFRFNQTFSPGYGFIGLTVALLGRLNPVGILIAALLYGVLEAGSTIMQLNTGVPLSLVNILEGVIIILMTATALTIRRRRRARRSPPVQPAPEASVRVAAQPEGEMR
jgi:simple sugar transport system permease protein